MSSLRIIFKRTRTCTSGFAFGGRGGLILPTPVCSRMVVRARSTSASEEKMRQEGDGGAQAEVGLILEMTIELAVAHATKPDGTAIIMHAKTIALI